MKDEESLKDAYARLDALCVRLLSLGCGKYNDGFIVNNEFMKNKIVSMMAPDNQQLALHMQFLDARSEMTPDDLVSYFVANEDMAAQEKKVKEMVKAMNSSNPALKDKVSIPREKEKVIEEEEEGVQEEEQVMTVSSDIGTDLAFLVKKWSGGGGSSWKKGKSFHTWACPLFCYNCGDSGHFSMDCEYEKREDKPKYEKKEFKGKKTNPFNLKKKKPKAHEWKAFIGATYTSDDEEEEEEGEDSLGMVNLAMASSDSLFSQDYSKNYNHSFKCLMAKGPKVKSSPQVSDFTPFSFANINSLDSNVINDDDDDVFKKLTKFGASLHGDARSKFIYLMELIYEKKDLIEQIETHIENEDSRVDLLEQQLHDEKVKNEDLTRTIKMYELHKVKTIDNLDEALKMSSSRDSSKKELEGAHASLTKYLEHREKSYKLIKGEFSSLRKTYDSLYVAHMKSLSSPSAPINDDINACTLNSTCDQASLILENKKLKDQLEKGNDSRIQSEKKLDEVLAHQKKGPSRGGIGFVPSKKTKDVIPPKKIVFVQEGHKRNEKKNDEVESGNATRSMPTHNNFAGKYNPSYMFCNSKDGVYAKYVGPRDGYSYREYDIWVPKTLLTNSKGPIVKWVPKL
jgi:hypothetical protein